MPCLACKSNYTILPCEHPTGVIDESSREKIRSRVSRANITISNSEMYGFDKCNDKCYKELHFNCPCKNCLIKTMCNEKFDDRCQEYIELIDKHYKIYYDEINGRYKTRQELEFYS